MVKYNAAAHVSYKSPFVYMHKGVQFTIHLNLNSLSYKCVQLCADIVPLALDCFSVSGNWMFPWILGFQKAISAKCIVSLLV